MRDRLGGVQDESRRGIASLAALSAASPISLAPGESGMSLGVGYFKSETGFAIDYSNRPSGKDGEGRVVFNVGAATAGSDETVYKFGVGYKFK